jgi:hypothetical protein
MTASVRIRALLRSVASCLRQAGPVPAPPGTRWMSVVRASYGGTLLFAPGPMITAVTAAPVSGRVRAVARVLGARQLVQAAVCGLAPARGLIQAGAAADGLHAASMLALASAEPNLRRPLLAETVIATALASVAMTSLCRSGRCLAGQRARDLAEACR